jgi:MoxR-like ATPase
MSRPSSKDAPDFIRKWVSYGASVRAAHYLILGGKARALMNGSFHVGFDDNRALARPVMRHRIIMNFNAQSERMTTDQLIEQLLHVVPTPRSGM